jgi:hydroxymethylbilane synthase
MSKNTSVTIGTRASPLALRQSAMVGDALRAAHGLTAAAITISEIITKGDRALDEKLSELGGKGLFTEELEAGLRSGAMDVAVHSLKDLPTQNADGLTLGAILPRANAADMLIARAGLKISGLADLPEGAHIGTASLRRQAQILRARPDVKISLLRGNIGTRLKKLDALNMDATLLAAAGLERLDMVPHGAVALASDTVLPAAGQGALAVQCRADDDATRALLAPLHCAATHACVTAERAFLNALDGSCRTPIAALAILKNDTLYMHGRLLAEDGSDMVETHITCAPDAAAQAGRKAGDDLRRAAPHLVTG